MALAGTQPEPRGWLIPSKAVSVWEPRPSLQVAVLTKPSATNHQDGFGSAGSAVEAARSTQGPNAKAGLWGGGL